MSLSGWMVYNINIAQCKHAKFRVMTKTTKDDDVYIFIHIRYVINIIWS